jgi:hypothetical protein
MLGILQMPLSAFCGMLTLFIWILNNVNQLWPHKRLYLEILVNTLLQCFKTSIVLEVIYFTVYTEIIKIILRLRHETWYSWGNWPCVHCMWATVVCAFALVSQGKFNVSSIYYKRVHCWTLPYLSNKIYYGYASIYFKWLSIPIMH